MLLGRLFKPLDYLRVNHPQKRMYDFTIPFVISVIAILILLFLPEPVKILGNDGLVFVFTGLLQILTGFYIASLAAVATFDKRDMDKPMSGKALTLTVIKKGKSKEEVLTRRRFLSLMFGYLSFSSFFIYFLGSFVELLSSNILLLIPIEALDITKWVCLFIYLFLVANLMVTTMLGLFYMTERIHRTEPTLVDTADE